MSPMTLDVPLGALSTGRPEDEEVEANGAVVLHGAVQAADSSSSSESDSDSDSDSDRAPPTEIGDVDPAKCKVSGPGFSGSGACAPVSLYLYAHDHYGRRLKSGGDDVVVRVSPASNLAGGIPIEATVSTAITPGVQAMGGMSLLDDCSYAPCITNVPCR